MGHIPGIWWEEYSEEEEVWELYTKVNRMVKTMLKDTTERIDNCYGHMEKKASTINIF